MHVCLKRGDNLWPNVNPIRVHNDSYNPTPFCARGVHLLFEALYSKQVGLSNCTWQGQRADAESYGDILASDTASMYVKSAMVFQSRGGLLEALSRHR